MITYCYVNTPIGTLLIACGEKGLRHIFFPIGGRCVEPDTDWIEDANRLSKVADELGLYFSGELKDFSVPLDIIGTPFQLEVWNALIEIPFGSVVSYKSVAEKIGRPKACRAVGGAVGKNPIPIIIPCHRVVSTDGSLTGFGGGLDTKSALLAIEGISLTE